LAPTVNEHFEKLAIKHPIIAEFLEAADGEIDKGVSKFNILPDLRETYQKYLGKRVGNIFTIKRYFTGLCKREVNLY